MTTDRTPDALPGLNHHLLVNDLAQQVADRMHAALAELEPELAAGFAVFYNDDGTTYYEPLDELEPAELELLDRAERLALDSLTAEVAR